MTASRRENSDAVSSESKSSRVVTPIVALDVSDGAAARAIVTRLGDRCRFYKVGLELFTAEGTGTVRWLREAGNEVFLDLKLHDIPNTVRGAARSAARLGASLLTVHASGGADMVRAAVEGAGEGVEGAGPRCAILGVTVLTSMDGLAVDSAWGRQGSDVSTEVLRLAGLVREGGGAGIVCSGHEAGAVRSRFGDDLRTLVPGIRLGGGDAHDQRRVMTPSGAADAGATWIILGRAVTGAPDPAAAMDRVREELARSG